MQHSQSINNVWHESIKSESNNLYPCFITTFECYMFWFKLPYLVFYDEDLFALEFICIYVGPHLKLYCSYVFLCVNIKFYSSRHQTPILKYLFLFLFICFYLILFASFKTSLGKYFSPNFEIFFFLFFFIFYYFLACLYF